MDNPNYVSSAYSPSYGEAIPNNEGFESKNESGRSLYIPPVTHTAGVNSAFGNFQHQNWNNQYSQPNHIPNVTALPQFESTLVATTTHTAQGTTTVYTRHMSTGQHIVTAIFIILFIAGFIWTIVSIVKAEKDFNNFNTQKNSLWDKPW